MINEMTHGWNGLLLGYAVSALGLWMGFWWRDTANGRTRQIVVAALPVMLVSGLTWTVVRETTASVWGDVGETATVLFGASWVFGCGFATAVFLSLRRPPEDILKRGTRLIDGAMGIDPVSDSSSALSLAGQAIPLLDETKHFKMIGTTGTGKSTAIRELLSGAFARGDRAMIADPDGGYVQRYYRPDRGDVILNPFDARTVRWDLFKEMRQVQDCDELARALIPDYDGSDRSWRQYARIFLTAVLRQLHRAGEKDVAKLYWLLLLAPAEELRELLDGTPAAPFLTSDNSRFFESVRSVTAVHVSAIEYVARQTTGDVFSVRDWVSSGSGVLFLPYRAGEIAALRQIISTWMRLGIFQAMDLPEEDRRLWFVVDELDALGAIDGLKDALVRLRKFGGRCVLGFQSIAQVRGTYGDAEAQTIVENCGTSLILRCSASERGGTAEFASRLIGKREIVREQISRSRPSRIGGSIHETMTTSDHHITEDAVMASEIEQLPDLNGFLKVASRPEWIRVVLSSQ